MPLNFEEKSCPNLTPFVGVRIPKKFLDDLMFEENELVEVKAFNGSILIQKAVKKYTVLDELFEGYNGNYKCSEYYFGEDIGREKVW